MYSRCSEVLAPQLRQRHGEPRWLRLPPGGALGRVGGAGRARRRPRHRRRHGRGLRPPPELRGGAAAQPGGRGEAVGEAQLQRGGRPGGRADG